MQVEFEKAQVKKLEKELKRLSGGSSTATSPSAKSEETDDISPHRHKQMAILLIKERNKLIDKLLQLQQRATQLENTLKAVSVEYDVRCEGL